MLSDKELIEMYKAGNQKALTLLVKKWHVPFCKLAYGYVKEAAIAKDIAQNSWQIILKKLYDLKDVDQFKSWAVRIVVRQSIDWIRKHKRERYRLEKYHKEHRSGVIEEVIAEEKLAYKQRIREEISKLTPEHQQIIRLFYTESYTLKEISSMLELSVGTVKSRLFHAREKLKITILKPQRHGK